MSNRFDTPFRQVPEEEQDVWYAIFDTYNVMSFVDKYCTTIDLSTKNKELLRVELEASCIHPELYVNTEDNLNKSTGVVTTVKACSFCQHREVNRAHIDATLLLLMKDLRTSLIKNNVALDEESNKLLYDNLWDLYEK